MTKKFIPAISVVIPMYNTEKYIGECIESVLVQTFQDFEIIVVDDCSTDNSCKIVEDFIKNFGEKIKLVRRNFNSGGGGQPRSDGVKISSGKYIFFLDADDLITKTAFEEIFKIAEDFSADVVCCEKYYQMNSEGKNITLTTYKTGDFATEPTLTGENVEEKINYLLNRGFLWNLWTKLIRRDFFVGNAIKMLNMAGEDFFASVTIISAAKKIIRVPNVINFYRIVEDSLSHKPDDVQKVLHKWIDALIQGTNYLEKFLNKQESFRNRTDLKYSVFETVAKEFLQYLLPIYAQIPAHQLDKIIRKEFEKVENETALTTFIFSRMNIFNLNLIQQQKIILRQQEQIKNLQAQLQK